MIADALRALARGLDVEWRALAAGSLQFSHRSESRLLLLALVGASLVLLVGRTALRRRPGRSSVVLPALPATVRSSIGAWLVHVPAALFLLGLPFLALALADPSTALVRREMTYPGRRICLAIDASNSMSSPFTTSTLRTPVGGAQAFFTTVAAAERFVQMRRQARFRDVVGLVEFGSDPCKESWKSIAEVLGMYCTGNRAVSLYATTPARRPSFVVLWPSG